MIFVQGWVRLAPGEIDRLRAAAVEMMRATKAAEPGCIEYAFAADLADPDLLQVVERWVDQAALDAHFQTAHMATFNQALGAAKVLDASLKIYAGEVVRTLRGAD